MKGKIIGLLTLIVLGLMSCATLPPKVITKSVNVGTQNLSYRESSGNGPTIVFVHGNSASSSAFKKQLSSSLGQKFRVIALDLPGHGSSANATSPQDTYSIPSYAYLLAAFAKEINETDATFVGWSLGGHAVLQAIPLLPDAKGFAIFGTPPISNPPNVAGSFFPHPAMGATFNPELSSEEQVAYVNAFFSADFENNLPTTFLDDVKRTDPNARGFLGQSIAKGNTKDESLIVREMAQPLAILHGKQEQLVIYDYFSTLRLPSLWRDEVQVIDGAGHAPQWEQPEAFNALIDAFVNDIQ